MSVLPCTEGRTAEVTLGFVGLSHMGSRLCVTARPRLTEEKEKKKKKKKKKRKKKKKERKKKGKKLMSRLVIPVRPVPVSFRANVCPWYLGYFFFSF